ncbi:MULTISPECIES: hypothetical protein [Variovorax]|uniref:hypothetical protein n=1 Tax=Variovorax TaxID=34072 RepID=UPI00086B1F8D|nr:MULTISPECIES: hypothetical protein [Variovorax]MBN8757252.1 hypothetical protein [Variovorax sp.]ODU13757.1 MAG: hypothetical protein ABS94_25645 [Variovorax sp. SCN 67-85]OJZ13679.1 MAG: hypothetical protein BGP22_26540 [Variovorax sp. 67-131]UKI06336.1 hypothetical protein L3V85_26450 [Variovorax paradoxus]
MALPHTARSIVTRRMRAIVLFGAALYGLYLASTTVAALMPTVRISVSVGRGILGPRFISFICGL